MNRIAVLNVVGMCDRHITRDMRFARLYRNNGRRAFIDPAFPAVTTTAQSNYLTGQTPSSHVDAMASLICCLTCDSLSQ